MASGCTACATKQRSAGVQNGWPLTSSTAARPASTSGAKNGSHSGGRFFLGYWFCDDHALGLEGGYFFTGPGVTNFSATSGGTPILTRPFINAATGAETTELSEAWICALAAPTPAAEAVVAKAGFVPGDEVRLPSHTSRTM